MITYSCFFFFNDTATTEIYTLSLHDALPISRVALVGQLRGQFGAIVVDSAPLGAGADGFALGTATGSLLVVLRTGVSDRELAEAKLGILQHLPINVLGAVLNDVRPGGAYRY